MIWFDFYGGLVVPHEKHTTLFEVICLGGNWKLPKRSLMVRPVLLHLACPGKK